MARSYLRNRSISDRSIIYGGILSGIIAGLAWAVFLMARSWLVGSGFFFPLKLISGTFWGVDAIIGGFLVGAVGFIVHMFFSALFGAGFSWITRDTRSTVTEFAYGLIYGVAIWALMTFIVVPIVNPTLAARISLMDGAWFFTHLIFGGFLALTPSMEESVERQIETEQRRAA